MKVTCSSSETALRSQKSSDILKKILKKLDSDIDIKYVISIFNKIKNLTPISNIEEKFISEIIYSDDFRQELEFFLSELKIPDEKKFLINPAKLFESFDLMSLNSRVIDILDNKEYDGDYLYCEGKTFYKLELFNKTQYLELLSENEEFSIFKNLRSNKFELVNTNNREVLIESKLLIEFSNKFHSDQLFITTQKPGNKNYVVCGETIFTYSKKSEIMENEHSLFFIDYQTSLIIQLDKGTDRITYRDFQPSSLGKLKNNYLLFFNEPEFIGRGDSTYSNGSVELYDIFKNKSVTKDIHVGAYHVSKNNLIYLSLDFKHLNYFNLETGESFNQKFSDIESYNPELSKYDNFLKLIKKETI